MTLMFQHGLLAAAGVAAAAVPIIIHLMMRSKPKPIIFPALELLRKRQVTTVRRLKVRNLLLLLLRILVLALLGLALARPTIHSELFSIDQKAPVAATIIIDTSFSMEYQHQGKSRLEDAKEIAKRVLQKLPDNSQVTILASTNPMSQAAPVDIPTAIGRLPSLEAEPIHRPLNDSIKAASRALEKSERDRREIYIISDLALNSFSLGDEAAKEIEAATKDIPTGIRFYVIPVNVEKPDNVNVGELKLSQQLLSANSELQVTVPVKNVGADLDTVVKITLDGEVRDSKPVHLPTNQAVEVTFKIPGMAEGPHQGSVSIKAGDPMPFDDERYFTVEVRPPIRAIVVTDVPIDGVYLSMALSPKELRRQNRAKYLVDSISSKQFPTADLTGVAAICLVNVSNPGQDSWTKLADFIRSGGGVFISLGERVDANAYNTAFAQAILPGKLLKEQKPNEDIYLDPAKFANPISAKFREFENSDISAYPVLRYFKVELAPKGTANLIPLTNGDPGVAERVFGDGIHGKSLLFTSAAHYRPASQFWTELPRSWSFVVLADQIMRYMVGIAEKRLNYISGSAVAIEVDPGSGFRHFKLSDPKGKIEQTSIDQKDRFLTITHAKSIGQYRVDAVEGGRNFSRAFSINIVPEESSLTAIDTQQIQDLLGKTRTSVARDPAELESVVDEGRVGRELFTWIMLLLLIVVTLEGYFANNFYRQAAPPNMDGPSASA